MYAYISPPAMVHLSKPAHYREVAFTDKTGGCNCEASVGEELVSTGPQGNQGTRKVTGGADFPTKPTCQQV